MFKPHYNICHGCTNRRLIITKRGFCQQCDPKQSAKRNDRISRGRSMGAAKRVPGVGEGTGRVADKHDNEKALHRRLPARKRPKTKRNDNTGRADTGLHRPEKATGNCNNWRIFKKRPDGRIRSNNPAHASRNLQANFRKKPTGELALFRKLYDDRGPYSQISGQWIAFSPAIASHILSKAAYPAFRLYEKNIVLKTVEEHHMWETQRHKLKDKPEWQFVFELEQELKREYYEQIKKQ